MSLLCACTDVEMCRDCKRANEISKAYERTKRHLLRDWNGSVDRMIADYFSVDSGVRCDLPGKVAGLSRRISPMPAGEGESERGSSPRNTAKT